MLIAVSAALLFGTGTTFTSMGIPLFAMAQEFHWSQAGAGASFLAMGLVCAATSLLPMVMIPRIGGRWTVVVGMLILAGGLVLASATQSLSVFFLASAAFGVAFSLVANSSGTYMIAGWFGDRSGPILGVYMMVGLFGGAVIPFVAGAMTAGAGGWRFYWRIMAAVAIVIAVGCAIAIREPAAKQDLAAGDDATAPSGWGYRFFLPTWQFIVLAAAMVGTQFCTVTVSAIAVPHFAHIGLSAEYAAQILGLQGLVGSVATGVAGWLSERYSAKLILVIGLLLEAIGTLLFAFAHSLWMIRAFVPVFGIGWSATSLAATVMLVRCFGGKVGTAALSTIWLLAGAATAGPSIAGLLADMTGDYTPVISLFGIMLLPVAVAILFIDNWELAITSNNFVSVQPD